MDQALVDLCNQTIQIEPFTGRDINQAPTYGASVSWTCRIETGNKIIRNGPETIVTNGRIYLVPLGGSYIPKVQDRVTFGETEGVLRTPVLKVQQETDEAGATDHYVLYY